MAEPFLPLLSELDSMVESGLTEVWREICSTVVSDLHDNRAEDHHLLHILMTLTSAAENEEHHSALKCLSEQMKADEEVNPHHKTANLHVNGNKMLSSVLSALNCVQCVCCVCVFSPWPLQWHSCSWLCLTVRPSGACSTLEWCASSKTTLSAPTSYGCLI